MRVSFPKPVVAVLLSLLAVPSAFAQPRLPSVVAAENVYGDIAAQIAGPGVSVTSILSNPDQDPHLFQASPSTARAVADAGIVVVNGLDYDPWMARLLRASRPAAKRQVIVASDLLHRKTGANPHLWYDPAAVPVIAKAIGEALAAADPVHAADYAARATAFEASLAPVNDKLAELRRRFAGQPVAATEPVFGYMAAAAGLLMRHERFQLAVMNGTEPRPSDVAAFEADLRARQVRVLIYNSQAASPAARRLLDLAKAGGVPVVGVTETKPEGASFQNWMLDQLDRLDAALSGRR